MINSAKKLQSDEFSTATTDSNILDQTPLLSQKLKSGNESEFSAKNRMWESMKSLSQNFSITGSQHLSRTSETTNIAKDEQQSQPFITMESLTAIEDNMIEKNTIKISHRSGKKIENPSLISLSTFSISSRLQKHDDHCRRQHRRKMWHTRSKLKKSDDKKNEENFLELLDEYKQKKFVLNCVCKQTRWSWFNNLWEIIKNIFRFIRQFIWCCCCPPILGYCLNKIAFWPPPREYYFFIGGNAKNISKSDREPLTQQCIVRKANKNCLKRKDLRFGFEHQCATEVFGIECFVTETEKKNHIACVFVRKARPRYTLLFSHPNGSDISDHLVGLPNLHDAASGYGISDGNPSEKNMYSDITAVYKYLLEDLSIPETNIILWGYSIGTVASIELAKQANKLAGLILLAPIASIIRTVCWGKCCWRRNKQCDHLANCCGDRFNSVKKISEIEMPTLIAHGVQDMIVTVEHGKALYQLCPGAVKPLWIPDVGHNNLENSSMLWRRMRKFIDREARPPLQRTKCKSLKKDIQNSIDLLNDCNHKCERKNLLV
uniref:Peptidase S9 prolyl oligopeptidase catalytic domain-containing protein n=1 Tax=Brugia malayi TaxID=6279 RepID=A0A7I4NN54_BRUMA